MRKKLDKRIIVWTNDEFKQAVLRLQDEHMTGNMSETIRRVILLAAKKLQKSGAA